jgi:hypothetical protein
MKRTAVVVAFCAATVAGANGQHVVPDLSGDGKARSGYMAKWDHNAAELIFYRHLDSRSLPAIRLVKPDGRTVAVRPLEDLPGAQGVTIWDVAEAPDGGIVFCATVEYAPPHTKPMPLKALVLTYNGFGQLTRFWDVLPYEHDRIAVDGRGEVFALGQKVADATDYPLLVKYSLDGEVLGTFLPASMFSIGDRVLDFGSPNGDPEMLVHGEELVIWLGPTQELLRLSLAGRVLARDSLENALKSLASETGSKRSKVEHLGLRPDGGVVAQIQLWPPDGSHVGLRTVMVLFSSDRTAARPISSIMEANQSGRFLGVAEDGNLVFLEAGTQRPQLVIRKY